MIHNIVGPWPSWLPATSFIIASKKVKKQADMVIPLFSGDDSVIQTSWFEVSFETTRFPGSFKTKPSSAKIDKHRVRY